MTADAEYQRPQLRLAPSPTAESRAFWTGGRNDELLIYRCHGCGHFFHGRLPQLQSTIAGMWQQPAGSPGA